MHMFWYLIPCDIIPGSMGTENRSTWIFKISIWIISTGFYDFFFIMADIISI